MIKENRIDLTPETEKTEENSPYNLRKRNVKINPK